MQVVHHVTRDAMEQMLKSGTHLVVDRYAFSGVAFSSAKVKEECIHVNEDVAHTGFLLGT